MNALIERLKQKVLTLSPSETDETEPELSAFGIVQIELEHMRNDITTLQKSIDALHAKIDALQTVNTFHQDQESVNTLAENAMLAHAAAEPVNTLKTPRKRSTTARRSTR